MRSSRSIPRRVFATAALPFVLVAAYTTYRTLSFKFAAAQAVGTVVEVTGPPPALVVEFASPRDAASAAASPDLEYGGTGPRLWRTESAGSDFYAGIRRGDPITVFYDPADPADARIDHFVEQWVVPLMAGVPAALVLVSYLIFARDPPRGRGA